MVTWGDFTLVGSTTGTGAGTLSITGVQQNDLIIACAAVRTMSFLHSPSQPYMQPSGIDTTELFSKNSIPEEAQWVYYPYAYWRYWYYPYYGYYWWYWQRRWWLRYPVVVSRISVWRADSAGTVSVEFSDPSGWGTIYATALRVWKPNISVGQNMAIRSIGFAESAQGASGIGVVASMPVVQDELLLAMGVDTTYFGGGNFVVSGPSVQELIDFNPVYAYRTARIKLWRVKTTTTATVTYSFCNAGRMLMKFVPNVDVYQVSRPVAQEPEIYVEIQADLTSSGRIIRPRWFEALRSEYAWSPSMGLRKRWTREATTSGEGKDARARVIEMWKFPASANASIPEGQAYTFVSVLDAEARVRAHDLGW